MDEISVTYFFLIWIFIIVILFRMKGIEKKQNDSIQKIKIILEMHEKDKGEETTAIDELPQIEK